MGNLDDKERREWLPPQLRNGRYGTNQRVFAAGEVGILAQAECCAVPQYGLVKDLEEVDPDQADQDGAIGFAPDPLAVFVREGDSLGSDLVDSLGQLAVAGGEVLVGRLLLGRFCGGNHDCGRCVGSLQAGGEQPDIRDATPTMASHGLCSS